MPQTRSLPLDDGTGEYVFDTWTNKVAKRSQMIALLPAGVRGDDIKRHPVWITMPPLTGRTGVPKGERISIPSWKSGVWRNGSSRTPYIDASWPEHGIL